MEAALKLIKIFVPVLIAFMTVNASSQAAQVTDLDQAEVYVQEIGDRAIALLANDELTKQAKSNEVRLILEDVMAIDSIARIVLGKPWRKMNDTQKEEYLSLFKDYLLTKYSGLVGTYNGQTVQVLKTVRAGKKDAMVFTTFAQNGAQGANVGWRIRTLDGALKLLDVKIEDISMVQTEREQFQTVYQNVKIEGLLNTLRKLTEKMLQNAKDELAKETQALANE